MEHNGNFNTPQTSAGDTLAKGAIIADVLVTIMVISGMVIDNHSVTISVLAGVAFFALFGALVILTLSGALPAMVINGQNQRTAREQIRREYDAQAQRMGVRVADPMQLPYTPPAEPPQLSASPSFVAPYAEADDGARREAVAWVLQLYGADGTPDPKKVLLNSDRERPGRVRVASPSRAAKEYLLDRGVLQNLGNGYQLMLSRCPTIDAARDRLQGYGGGGIPTDTPHPYPHPQEREARL